MTHTIHPTCPSPRMGCLYFTVMLLIALQSTHIPQVSSFLGTSSTGIVPGLMLSLTCPLVSSSLTCLWSSLVFSALLLQAGQLGIVAPGTKLIWYSIPPKGGYLLGTSLGNTSSYSCNKETTTLGKDLSSLLVLKHASVQKYKYRLVCIKSILDITLLSFCFSLSLFFFFFFTLIFQSLTLVF